jgi:hypothetical protein
LRSQSYRQVSGVRGAVLVLIFRFSPCCPA